MLGGSPCILYIKYYIHITNFNIINYANEGKIFYNIV